MLGKFSDTVKGILLFILLLSLSIVFGFMIATFLPVTDNWAFVLGLLLVNVFGLLLGRGMARG